MPTLFDQAKGSFNWGSNILFCAAGDRKFNSSQKIGLAETTVPTPSEYKMSITRNKHCKNSLPPRVPKFFNKLNSWGVLPNESLLESMTNEMREAFEAFLGDYAFGSSEKEIVLNMIKDSYRFLVTSAHFMVQN